MLTCEMCFMIYYHSCRSNIIICLQSAAESCSYLARDGSSAGGHESQNADGEPAREVRECDGDEAACDGQVLALSAGVARRQPVVSHRPEDKGLARRDGKEEDKVDDDDDGEGIVVSGKVDLGEGQGHAEAGLAVEVPV